MPFPDLPARLREVRQRVAEAARRGGHGQAVRIIAVTKGHEADAVAAALEAGLADIGENRVQEAVRKMDAAAAAVRWHLIGHLQRNKAKNLVRFAMLHSLDSVRLAEAVAELDGRLGPDFGALVQVNVAGEATKGGFSLDELPAAADRLLELTQREGQRLVPIQGVMTMAPFDADERVLRAVFAGARRARELLCAAGHTAATELSMGMSNDYELAVEEGATYIRLGTVLFGSRSA
jgi:PLP dependent protein